MGIVKTPYLPSLRQRYLFIGVQDYSHIGRLLRILVLTRLGYRSLIWMIWEGIIDYPHFGLSLWEIRLGYDLSELLSIYFSSIIEIIYVIAEVVAVIDRMAWSAIEWAIFGLIDVC